jgi:chaperonin cofactor prefoldin
MLVYVIALEEELNFELKVSQPEEKSDLEARVEALENEVYKTSKSEKRLKN